MFQKIAMAVMDVAAGVGTVSFLGMFAYLIGYILYYQRAVATSPSEFPKKFGQHEWS